jgi:hypothetical protein
MLKGFRVPVTLFPVVRHFFPCRIVREVMIIVMFVGKTTSSPRIQVGTPFQDLPGSYDYVSCPAGSRAFTHQRPVCISEWQ